MNNVYRQIVVAIVASCATSATIAAPPLEERSEQIFPVPPATTVSLKNTDGTIYVYGSDKAEMKVVARKKAYSKARLDGISVKVDVNGDSVVLDTVYPPTPKGLSFADRSGTVDYVIILPQTCTLSQVDLVNGEILIEGMRGSAINARLTSGRMLAQDCFSATRLVVENGGLDIVQSYWEAGVFSLEAEIRNGDLRLALPKDAAVRLEASASTGWIRNGFSGKDDQTAGRSMNVTIGTEATAEFNLRTTSGNIRIERE